MQIRTRLWLSYAFVIVVSVALVATMMLSAAERHFLAELRTSMASEARLTGELLQRQGTETLGSRRGRELLARLDKEAGRRITVIGPDGQVLGDSRKDASTMENHGDRPEVRQAIDGGAGSDVRLSETLKVRFLYVAVRSRAPDGTFVTRLAFPLTEVNSSLQAIADMGIRTTLVVALGALLAGLVLAGALTRPIQDLKEFAGRLASGRLSERPPVKRRDEIGELSESLERMAGELASRMGQLTGEKEKLQLILDNMTDGILLLGRNGDVLLANRALEKIFRRPSSELVGKPLSLTTLSAGIEPAVRQALETGQPFEADADLWRPLRRTIRVHALPLTESPGRQATLVVVQDVTKERETERLRKDFVANVSHELKTPLASLKLAAETLLLHLERDPKGARKFAESIDQDVDRLSTMVGDLLELSRYESPQAEPALEAVDLNNVMREVISLFEAKASERGISLSGVLEPALPPIQGSREQLSSLAANLIDNAIEYNSSGGSAEASTRHEGGMVRLVVSDTGEGIPEKDRQHVFERFYRVDKARSRSAGGTGLGLSIVKHVAASHGAKIALSSTPGEGTTVTVDFPSSFPLLARRVFKNT
ncbi:MAG: HAMP domain-containing protein [Actinobacteria bacterium]|nr:MAG: HAMP domain-containing protein [Actinomycetota bacterium]